MRRERVLGNFQGASKLSGRQTLRLMTCQNTKCVQPSGLSERGERQDRFFIIHISRLMDITAFCQPQSGAELPQVLETRAGELLLELSQYLTVTCLSYSLPRQTPFDTL